VLKWPGGVKLEVIAIGTDNKVYKKYQRNVIDLTDWSKMRDNWNPNVSVKDIEVGERQNARPEVFAIRDNDDPQVYQNYWTKSGSSGEWKGWREFPNSDLKVTDIEVGELSKSGDSYRLALFGIEKDTKRLYKNQWLKQGDPWSGWSHFGYTDPEDGPKKYQEIEVGVRPNGRLDVFAISADDKRQLYVKWMTKADDINFSGGWGEFGDPNTKYQEIEVGVGANGGLHVFAISDNSVYHRFQNSANSEYSDWNLMKQANP